MAKIEVDGKQFQVVSTAILDEIADKLVAKMKENTVKENAVATGEFARAFKKQKISDNEFKVYNDSPIAKYVEWGTEPHRPPFEPILEWVKTKKGETGEEAKRAAWKIATKIEREGTKPKLIISKSVVDIVREYNGSGVETFMRRGKAVSAWRDIKTGRFVRSD